ncbi:MAG: HlyD family type I secretion periplasmic adaptor subunit [Pseudoruegeria sp.]
MTESHPPIKPLRKRLLGPAVIGLIVVSLFFGGFGTWALTAPISGAAVATGTVGPENARRTVQHLEGGVISKIFVRDGETVQKDQLLVLLDDTKARTSLASQEILVEVLQARRQRLRTELELYFEKQNHGILTFSQDLVDASQSNSTTQDVLTFERARFESRLASLRSNQELLRQSILSYEVEIIGLENELISIEAQLDLFSQEIEVMDGLRKKGLELQSRVFETLRNIAQAEQQRAERLSRIAQLRETIKSTELQEEDLWIAQIDEATSELSTIIQELITAVSTIDSYRDTLIRTEIRAPVDGTLIELSVNTEGGVLDSGATVVEIVPSEDALTLEAHISPNDIDIVAPGQSATVTLLAYPQRNLPKLHGILEYVSADSIVDSNTGESYYLGKLQLTEEELKRLGEDVKLIPGMSVQIMIQTSSRTFFDYLMSPILNSADLAFKEQ